MTDSGSDAPEDDSVSSGANDGASIEDSATNSADSPATLPDQLDAEMRSLLGSLKATETPMPAAVHDRISAALAAEPNPYAAQAPAESPTVPATGDSDTVIALDSRRPGKNRWLVAGAGIAAAGVLGVVLVPSLISGEGTTPALTAAVVPMTSSGTVYEKQGLVTQISSALPEWKQAVTDSADYEMVELPAADSDLADLEPTLEPVDPVVSAPVGAAPTSTPAVMNKHMLGQINDCVREMDTRTPIHVDIASYRSEPSQPAEPVAVFALDGDNEDVEIYVVSVKCTASDPGMVREHVTVLSG